jgi:hypothetical protein
MMQSHSINSKIIALIVGICLTGMALQVSGQTTIEEADNLFYGLDLPKAEAAYQELFNNDQADDASRALAGRKLAYIAWHFYGDLNLASATIKKSLKFGEYTARLTSDWIDYESRASRFDVAKKIYLETAKSSFNRTQQDLVATAFANMILQETFDRVKNHQSLDKAIMQKALQAIELVNEREPGKLKTARIQLGLALFLNDGPKALDAWKLYYNIQQGEVNYGLLAMPFRDLSNVLTGWHQQELNDKDRDQLIQNLLASGFWEFAWFLEQHLSASADAKAVVLHDIGVYYHYCREIENHLFRYYKEIALTGKNGIRGIKKTIETIQKDTWKALTWEQKPPSYSPTAFFEELYRRFHTKIYSGTYNQIAYYIGGHAIIDEIKTVTQFGQSTDIQFIALDNRFSNNYWGWFTGYHGFSGYANGELIVRYREPAAGNPMRYWKKIKDTASLKKWEEEIGQRALQEEGKPDDLENRRLSGVYERIRLKIYTEILDSLQIEGLQGDDLRKAFINLYEQISYNHIMNHEGRHAIDFNTLSKSVLNDDAELEYRAILSQIYFSDFPLLDLPLETDNTPHGLAIKRLLTRITEWMNQNSHQIEGFDTSKSAVYQIDLLTKAQVKEIVGGIIY